MLAKRARYDTSASEDSLTHTGVHFFQISSQLDCDFVAQGGVWTEEQTAQLHALGHHIHEAFQQQVARYSRRAEFIMLRNDVHAYMRLYRDIYMETLRLICSTEQQALHELNHLTGAYPVHTSIAQSQHSLPELLRDAFRTKDEYFDPFFDTCIRRVASPAEVSFHPARLKGVWRCLEKADRASSCAKTFDVVRGMIHSQSIAGLAQALELIRSSVCINVVRVKNRFQQPNDSGWADCLVNLYFVDDPSRHVCEVQLVHEKMLLVRKPMGAHENYAHFRGKMEVMEELMHQTPRKYVCLSIHDRCSVRDHALVASSFGLAARFPLQLHLLTSLQRLDLSFNELEGPLPPVLGELQQLQELNIAWNRLSGAVPASVIQLPHLTQFHFLGNPTIEITQELLSKEKFAVSVEGCALTHFFHSTQGSTTWIHTAVWRAEVYDMTFWYGVKTNFDTGRVHELRLSGNNLSGRIHESLGVLRELQVLQLSHNHLTGHIPQSISGLAHLRHLGLSYNALTGRVPDYLGEKASQVVLPMLQLLDLSHNQFIGAVPEVKALRIELL